TISNVLQLDETGLPALYLVHLAVAPRRGSSETLPSIVSAIRSQLDTMSIDALSAFNTQLIKVGYLEAHASQYSDIGYEFRHIRAYHVRDGFPRIKECNLTDGVGDVRYSIVAAACSQFEVTSDALRFSIVQG